MMMREDCEKASSCRSIVALTVQEIPDKHIAKKLV